MSGASQALWLHIDAFSVANFDAPGHRTTGDRDKPAGLGDVINVSTVFTRGAVWMREQGCGPIEAVMSENPKCYTDQRFAQARSELNIRRIRVPPCTPR